MLFSILLYSKLKEYILPDILLPAKHGTGGSFSIESKVPLKSRKEVLLYPLAVENSSFEPEFSFLTPQFRS